MTKLRSRQQQSGAVDPKIILIIVVVAVVVGAFWYFSREGEPPPRTVEPVEPAPTPPAIPQEVEDAPDIPAEEPGEYALVEEEPAAEIPPLADSDPFARETLNTLSDDDEFALWLQTENLVQKATSIIDGFSKGNVLYKIIPIQPPEKAFKVVKLDDRIYLDEANYARYDPLVSTLTRVPPETAAAAFQTLRPLFEEAYAGLGNPADKVDNSLVAAIDIALKTPDVADPIALKRESVLYQFADPDIESLPQIQKQLIRMGPDNRNKFKRYLSDVRAALLQQSQPE